MRYIPIHVDTKDARILIIGGEEAAEAKLRTLIKTEADLILVAPELSPEITRWAEKGILTHVARDFEPSDLDNVRLVYAATEDDDLNLEIGNLARARGLLVNAASRNDSFFGQIFLMAKTSSANCASLEKTSRSGLMIKSRVM